MVADLAASDRFTCQDPLVTWVGVVNPIDRLHLVGNVIPSSLDELSLFSIRCAAQDLLRPCEFSLGVVGCDLRGAEVGGFLESSERRLFFSRLGTFVRVGCRVWGKQRQAKGSTLNGIASTHLRRRQRQLQELRQRIARG